KLGLTAKTLQIIPESNYIRLVERSIHLIQYAKRNRACAQDGKKQCDCCQRSFSAGQKLQRSQFLSRGAGDDFNPGLKDIPGVCQFQFRMAAAEQLLEHSRESGLYFGEHPSEPF